MDVGGQAVIEGVMMRNKEKYAVAVRLPTGKIKVMKENNSKYPSSFNLPFLRGIVGLAYTLYDGIRALIWSSNQNLGVEEKLSKKEIVTTLLTSFLLTILIFVAIPFFSARFIAGTGIWFDVLDGVFRVALFLIYLGLISYVDDIRRLFQYHGAEHKAIYCYESGKPLTVENVKKFARFHPRCGTSFIFVVLLLSILVFSFIDGPLWVKFLGRIALLPVLAGIGYEIIKLSAKYTKNPLVRFFTAPGLWMQRITTKEPTEKQLEVSIAALKAVLK